MFYLTPINTAEYRVRTYKLICVSSIYFAKAPRLVLVQIAITLYFVCLKYLIGTIFVFKISPSVLKYININNL
uniref:Uncharacterized protein n=1 Tax=Siphoviridae sp. ctCIv11 TaxID=2827806 RepID=A0A8S5S1L7_9CAUD|nr:MAG TPA: hypothetical protein [Siphoviridae sp. ctCIv11]DAQ41971.1 MAG TPA: hypothetical protein [Caudoviricetes sp.]